MAEESAQNVLPEASEIVSFICDELEKVNPDNISLSADTDMTTDLNVDSLAVMDLMFAIEERFDVSIALNELSDIRKISELADLVFKAAEKR